MARALTAVGVAGGRARTSSRGAPSSTWRSAARSSVDLDRLRELAVDLLGEERGRRAVRQLRRFRDLQELDLPVILLVGGGTGTGKSTVATEVAYRLGITRVTSTDFVRQTMRAFFAKEFMPSIHYSSFEAGLGLTKAEEEESGDAALLGFLDQTRNVLTGVEAALQRALDEGWSMVLEGVHLVPGMITTELRERARRPVRARDPRRGDPPRRTSGSRDARLRRHPAGRPLHRRPARDPDDPGLRARARRAGTTCR